MSLIQAEKFPTKNTIDLRGPEGNAYYLLGVAQRLSISLQYDWPAINEEMTSSDYRHLVETFDHHFGDLYDLLLPDNWEELYPRANKFTSEVLTG